VNNLHAVTFHLKIK